MKKVLGLAMAYLGGVAVLVVPVYLMPALSPPGVRQPAPFNHRKHVAAGWKCANCHPFVDQQTFAGLPRAQDCIDCHEKEQPKHPQNRAMQDATAQLRQMVTAGKDYQWVQVHRTARHAFFSHRRHVVVGKIDCKNCHGDAAKMDRPFTRPAFPSNETAKMDWCLSCHQRKRASTDCAACHR